jgi:hypothetical protein
VAAAWAERYCPGLGISLVAHWIRAQPSPKISLTLPDSIHIKKMLTRFDDARKRL